MEAVDKEKIAIALLRMINEKREEIKKLTSEILELENDPKNIVKIKQNVQSILNAVASCSNSKSNDLELVKLSAEIVFDVMRMLSDKNSQSIEPHNWGVCITHRLEAFCTHANAWNPIEYNFDKKRWKIDFKNINFSIFNINE